MKALSVLCLGMLILFCSFGLLKIVNAGGEIIIVDDGSFERHFGDFNGDFIVDEKDAAILEQNLGTHNVIADANGDGFVDIFDALVISSFYSFQWPIVEPYG